MTLETTGDQRTIGCYCQLKQIQFLIKKPYQFYAEAFAISLPRVWIACTLCAVSGWP